MARRNPDEDGYFLKKRKEKSAKMIRGEGDPLDPVSMLATIQGFIFIASMVVHMYSVIWMVPPISLLVSVMWFIVEMALALGIGVTVYWATERSGIHIKASGHKPMPYNQEFVDRVEVSHSDDLGYKLTRDSEGVRSGGNINWWKSHGGKMKPYVISQVPGSIRRFHPNGEELGDDWVTPKERYDELAREILDQMERVNKRYLTVDKENVVRFLDEMILLGEIVMDDEGKPVKLWGTVWKHEFFPHYIPLMRNNGVNLGGTQNPGRAGVHWGSDYLIFGDHGRVPLHKMKSEYKELLGRDKPYCQPYSWGMVSETVYPFSGPIPDMRPPDFRVVIEDARRRQTELEGDIEIVSEIQSGVITDLNRGKMPYYPMPLPDDEDKGNE